VGVVAQTEHGRGATYQQKLAVYKRMRGDKKSEELNRGVVEQSTTEVRGQRLTGGPTKVCWSERARASRAKVVTKIDAAALYERRCQWEGDVVDLDLSKICNGASLWLLGVAAALQGDTQGFSIF
jgi:hypothetical protein